MLLNNLGSKHSLISPAYVILRKKIFYQKIIQKLRPEN